MSSPILPRLSSFNRHVGPRKLNDDEQSPVAMVSDLAFMSPPTSAIKPPVFSPQQWRGAFVIPSPPMPRVMKKKTAINTCKQALLFARTYMPAFLMCIIATIPFYERSADFFFIGLLVWLSLVVFLKSK